MMGGGDNMACRPQHALHLCSSWCAAFPCICCLWQAASYSCPSATAGAQGLVVFVIDGDHWTLDLREGAGAVTQGPPIDKADLTLTISDENFAKMVMGKLSPQQVRPFRDGWMESLHVTSDSQGPCLLVPARHVPTALTRRHQRLRQGAAQGANHSVAGSVCGCCCSS
jgi:hypothetical protein